MFNEEFEKVNKEPMSFQELQQRLKQIAGLCWGLSIDLQNEIERRDILEEENKALKAENKILSQRLANRSKSAKYYRKQCEVKGKID